MLKNSLKYSSFQAPKSPLDSNVEEEGHDREASDGNDNSSTNDDNHNPNHANTTTTHDDPTEMHHWKRLSMAPLPLTHSYAFSTREKVVGLKDAGALSSSWRARRHEFLQTSRQMNLSTDTIAVPTTIMTTTEEKEEIARRKETKNPIVLLLLGNLAAFKVMILYLISLETILTCSITSGLIVFWYNLAKEQDEKGQKWTGGSMDFIILAFAVISPISAAIGMAFTRREGALMTIADMISFVHHLYLAHCLWDWPEHDGGRAECDTLDLFAHCDAVLAQLVGIGDELSRFLTLPTTSRSRHRMTKHGRKEAARTIEVAYRLLESMVTHRMTRLSIYAERIKKAGLSAGEVSRIRQYERFIHNSIERLRMYKMYRTPQALRSFARIFTFLLPPFYAPKFAQVAIDLNSLEIGLVFGIITTIGLTALFESLQVLEDPFVGYLTLDGIDVREEFEVLMWSTLVKTRSMIFPDAPPYPMGRRAAMVVLSPEQKGNLSRKPSTIHIARNATSRVSMGASSSHVDAASRRDLHATSIGGGIADEDSDFVLMDSHHRPPPTTSSTSAGVVGVAGVAGVAGVDDELSLLTIQTNSYDPDDDIEAAEFGHPILEDPVSEEFLRQTNYRHDGQLVQHRRSKSARSSSSLVGLVWRNNATASPQRSVQQL